MFSCRKALMRAIRVRMARYASRSRRRKKTVTAASTGTTARVIRASDGAIASRIARIETSLTTSMRTVTTSMEKNSFSDSTSVVTRVMRRPTGFASKKEDERDWRWANTAARMS